MPRILAVLGLVALMLFSGVIYAVDKKQAGLIKIENLYKSNIEVNPSLITADTCIVRHDFGVKYKIDGWVSGIELYKSYLDPSLTCDAPFPFTVTRVNMPMYFGSPMTLNVSVDVEDVDYSISGCPFPGELLTVSSEYEVTIPQGGYWYNIWITLDTPVVVDGPFFAGFFISNSLDPLDSAAVLIDSVPVPCVSYNIWDDSIGWVDLADNQYWNFPGRLVLYASGIPNGNPSADLEIIYPPDNDTIMGSVNLWAADKVHSDIVDYVEFEYKSTGSKTVIGQVVDGTTMFRDGTNPAGSGNGYSLNWDCSGLTEGIYTIYATAYDNTGGSSSDSVIVYIEPTPPTPTIISPSNGDYFCSSINLLLSVVDEDMQFIQGFYLKSKENYSSSMVTLGPSSQGSFYNAPMAAVMAMKVWFDRGYIDLMKEAAYTFPLDTVVNWLAKNYMNTVANNGTYDDDMFNGWKAYLDSRGVDYYLDYMRKPDYYSFRNWVENEQRAVVLGIGGTPGFWVGVDGFTRWNQGDGSYVVRISNPLIGSKQEVTMRYFSGNWSLYINGTWHKIDLMISLHFKDWSVTRTSFGADVNGNDGWSITWTPTGMNDGDWYYFHTLANDAVGIKSYSNVLLNYSCLNEYIKGDYNNDSSTDILDLDMLIQYIVYGNTDLIGGNARSDANCDGTVNVTDVVYYMNYLFGGGLTPAPCY
ncbi:MAG: dockerin type I domain-containing protein [bacterium]